MHRQMKLLRDLQALDHYIDRLRRDVATLDDGEQLRASLERTRIRTEIIKRNYHELHAKATEQERRLKEFDEYLRRREAELYSGKITSARELQLMQVEIDEAKRSREEMDVEMLRVWERMETMKHDIDATERDLEKLERHYEAHMADYRQRKAALEAEIEFHLKERAELTAQIDPELLARYERLREQLGGTAVAIVEQKACTVCYTLLTPYTLKRLETEDSLVACESCGRLLYDPMLATE
ncbi:MAG: zinc ribbon domain-containing protein [Fimbriimonadales bacterium]